MVREYWTLLPMRYYMRFVMVNFLFSIFFINTILHIRKWQLLFTAYSQRTFPY